MFFGVCWIELLVEIVILGVVLVGVSLICGYGVVVGTWMKWGCWLGDQGRLAWLELGPGDLHRSLVWKPRTGGFAREFWLSFFASSKQMQMAAMSARSTPGATVTKYCESQRASSIPPVVIPISTILVPANPAGRDRFRPAQAPHTPLPAPSFRPDSATEHRLTVCLSPKICLAFHNSLVICATTRPPPPPPPPDPPPPAKAISALPPLSSNVTSCPVLAFRNVASVFVPTASNRSSL